ncbi:MAG TPA: hypothetical protein VH325_11295 [Bryobacteraceae bacterium]|jgi:hypothetical protein|nr:hypothetical protein [Bryobacteraceae bacterium]
MDDITQLAQQAMTAIAPLIPFAAAEAGKVADGFLSKSGEKLFDWLKSQFSGKPAEATLDRAIAEPENERRLTALRLEIEEMAEKDGEFRQQLTELVKAVAAGAGITATQTANASGTNNKIGQAAGKDINIHIG